MNKKIIFIFLIIVSSFAFILADSSIKLEWIYPTTDINVEQNEFFNVSVNVSCFNENCGEINVSLDPPQTSYNFTTCGKTGTTGPSQANCDTNYTNTSLQGLVTVGAGIQNWTVPSSGLYSIVIAGAGGGGGTGNPGDGIIIRDNVNLIQGQVLKIIVGQKGEYYGGSSGAGGGGSFIVGANNSPILIAGGGTGSCNSATGQDGRNTTSGGGVSPGTNGSGGGTGGGGGGGGGLLTNGTSGSYGPGGGAFIFGGMGGLTAGGFGGGGGQTNVGMNIAGGGGGYSGGSGNTESNCVNAGGGGSYNATSAFEVIGTNPGAGYIGITFLGSLKGGLISTTTGTTPFYTTTANPYNLTLNEGESQIITWQVNATGSINIAHNFFIYANKTSNESINNITSTLNITITDTTSPIINMVYPTNTTYATSISELNYTYFDANTGYCWYSLDNGITNSSSVVAGINFTNLTSSGGSNTWIVYCNDSSGNKISDEITFTSSIPIIGLSLISPTSSINVTQNQTFQVRVNVSCSNNNCGAINVNLDPISGAGTNYSMYNSSETGGEEYDWEEIILDSTGTPLWNGSTADDSSLSAVLSFNFSFYGTNYSTIYVSSNGRVHFTSTSASSTSLSFPSSSYQMIAPVNRDMYVRSYTKVFYKNATNPTRTIIQYQNLDYYSGGGNLFLNYEIILYADGKIKVQYKNSSTAFVGSQNTGLNYNATSYLATGISAAAQYIGMALTFYPPGYSLSSTKGGLVSTTTGATPFYTTTANPYNLSLNESQSQIITWIVNATGNPSNTTNYEFFVYANQTSNPTIGNISQKWNVSIVDFAVDYTAPEITINSPIDNSGNEENITFEYVVSDSNNITNCSLFIGGEVNQTESTITKDIEQNFVLNNLNIGNYNWVVNCSDIFNNIGTSGSKKFSVIKKSKFVGNTTNLSLVNIQNITNLIIENPTHGYINFTQTVNLSLGADFNSYVNISFNRIEINSSALPELNKSARLTLYNLIFTNPQILKDGAICEDCIKEDYTNGTLIFNVTGFSIYSSQETPTTIETSVSTGGGGGGGSSSIKKECTLDSDCKQGYSCYTNKCVKLFDVEILNIEHTINELGFNLKYLIKGMAEIKGDVIIKFWLESKNQNSNLVEKIELGQDAIYLGIFEEKTKTTTLNLPNKIKNQDYDLYVQVNFENYKAESFRKININLEKGIEFASETKDYTGLYRFFNSLLLWIITGILIIILILIIKKSLKKKLLKNISSQNRACNKDNEDNEDNKKQQHELKTQEELTIKQKIILKIILIKKRISDKLKENLEFGFGRLKKPKKIKGAISIYSLLDKSLFDTQGDKIGIVEQPIIKENRIYGWVVKLKETINLDLILQRETKSKNHIIIKQEHIRACGSIFIIDEQIADILLKRKKD